MYMSYENHYTIFLIILIVLNSKFKKIYKKIFFINICKIYFNLFNYCHFYLFFKTADSYIHSLHYHHFYHF